VKYFIPDWEDRLDPDFDFETDSFSRAREDAYTTDVYAHQIFDKAPYDGVLVSLATLNGGKLPHETDENGVIRLRGYKTIRGYLRLRRPLEVMGDCGAFDYVNEDVPPAYFSTERVATLYEALRFDYGVSVDHMVVDFVVKQNSDGTNIKVRLTKAQKESRRQLSLKNAKEFLQYHKKNQLSFVPVGAAQGSDPATYADSVKELLKWGYRYVAVGTLIPKTDDEIVLILKVIKEVVDELPKRERRKVRIHLLGVLRSKRSTEFATLGVTSFDSASYLRKAWLRSGQNYLAPNGDWFAAIRIPYSDNRRLVGNAKSEGIESETLTLMERECLQTLKRYEAGEVTVRKALDAILEYDQLLLRDFDGNHHREKYQKTLEMRPWEKCDCEVCESLGINVVIFRGCNRNKRRGFHNTKIFYEKILNAEVKRVVIVGCGKAKVWDKNTALSRVAAKNAYVSSLFKLCRQYAERHDPHGWAILSAKYGLIHPSHQISNYDVRFSGRKNGAAEPATIAAQWSLLFPQAREVISLASEDYNEVLSLALPCGVKLRDPMRGLDLFQRMAWLKSRLIETDLEV